MTDIRVYLVGGAVRDELLGVRSKDLDYSVVVGQVGKSPWGANTAYDLMRLDLLEKGFKIFLDTPEYFTIRARFPAGHVNEKMVGDFVLARRDGPYSDGRRPDWVEAGTLEDDLSRRDFSVNALAKAEDGSIIDLFGGQEDLKDRRLRAVGDPRDRLTEDALRAFRAIRFAITKGFTIDEDLMSAMRTVRVLDALANISAERIKDEMHKCFAFDSVTTMMFMVREFPVYLDVMQSKGIWLEPTMKTPKGVRPVKQATPDGGNTCTGFGGMK